MVGPYAAGELSKELSVVAVFETIVLKISHAVQRIEEGLLSAAILGIAALTILNVVSRTALNQSLAFAEEVSQFLIIVVCFVGLSYAASKGRHIRMTAIYDQLSDRRRKQLMLVITAATSLLMLILGIYACRYVYSVYQLGATYPTLGVPFWVVYLSAPLGLFLGAIQHGLAFLRNLTEDEIYLSFEDRDRHRTPDKAREA